MNNSVRYERSNSSEQMQFNILSDSGGGSSFVGGESPRTPSRVSVTPANSSPDEPTGPGNVSSMKPIKICKYVLSQSFTGTMYS